MEAEVITQLDLAKLKQKAKSLQQLLYLTQLNEGRSHV